MLWLRYVALPNVDAYRDAIVASIEEASGMSLAVRAMSGHWDGLRPALALEGVALVDRRGHAAFQLERVEATLSWWWLAAGELRFHDVDLHRPDLELRRGADGLIYLADTALNRATGEEGDDDAFTEWLLAQRRVRVHDATLTWRDDFLGAPEVRLVAVEIQISRRLGHHRAALTARPPAELAGRIDLRADVVVRKREGQWRATGDAYLEARDADIGRLRTHLPVPETLRSAVGSVRVWLRFTPQGVDEAVADLNVRDARAQLAADALPLDLAALSGRAIYRTLPDGFSFETQRLRFRLGNGVEARPGNFSLVRSRPPQAAAARLEVRADGIDVKIAATLIDYFPVPREVKQKVLRFAPRGRISEAQVAWTDDGARAWSVKGRFEDLAVNAVDAFPGVAGLSGRVEGNESGGTLSIAARAARLDLRTIFRAPLAFDELEARARWRRAGGALEVALEEARFANADVAGSFSGTWRPAGRADSPGVVDLKGVLTRASAAGVGRYLPNNIPDTREWLEAALLAGESPRATFELRGDLWEFPFGGDSTGRFLVEGEVRGARLRYHPDWPSVDGIDGTLRFENRRMEIRAERATILASRVRSASAVIEDLAAEPPHLAIEGEVETTGGDSVRFLRASPLADGPGAFTRALAIEGPARLKLRIGLPLWGPEPARVAGDYQFNGATASAAGGALAMANVRGRLAFTERGVRAPEITATMFGRPATLALATQPDGQVVATLEGRADAAALAAHVPASLASRLSGETAWKARLATGGESTRLTVSSDLAGLAADLPAPLAKPAAAARALSIELVRLGEADESGSAELAGGVFARFHRLPGAAGRWHAALGFGARPPAGPAREGLWLHGELAALDVDAWQAAFAPGPASRNDPAPAPAEGALALSGLDLALARAHFLGRDFRDLRARLERTGTVWRGRLESPLIAGDIAWDEAGRGRLTAKLERFAVPEQAPGARAAPAGEPLDLPALDIAAARFDFRGRTLGTLELKAEPDGAEWRIDRLDIGAGHATLASTGVWRRNGAGSLTTLKVRLDARNLSALLAIFGYGDHVRRGAAELEGTLAWPGYPYEFALASLSGSLRVEARGGQFAKIEPGAGKLLGLLSLQSLPRRALFDFRDVFSEGFAFERIEGEVRVTRGVLHTEDFAISGPSAFVTLSGEVAMPQETQSLTLRVVPEVGEGMALAATVFGTPVLGLSTLLMSKLLKNPLGKAVAYEYQVTGSWDNPVVTRTSAPPARTAASSPPEAAKPAAAPTPETR